MYIHMGPGTLIVVCFSLDSVVVELLVSLLLEHHYQQSSDSTFE